MVSSDDNDGSVLRDHVNISKEEKKRTGKEIGQESPPAGKKPTGSHAWSECIPIPNITLPLLALSSSPC